MGASEVMMSLLERLYKCADRILIRKHGWNENAEIELQNTAGDRITIFVGQGYGLEDVLLNARRQVECFLSRQGRKCEP